MRLNEKAVWIVRDPGPTSELVDIFWETTFGELPKSVLGAGQRWYDENTTLYDDEVEAREDAEARLKVKPPREQWM
jgi:hypothetical protein